MSNNRLQKMHFKKSPFLSFFFFKLYTDKEIERKSIVKCSAWEHLYCLWLFPLNTAIHRPLVSVRFGSCKVSLAFFRTWQGIIYSCHLLFSFQFQFLVSLRQKHVFYFRNTFWWRWTHTVLHSSGQALKQTA